MSTLNTIKNIKVLTFNIDKHVGSMLYNVGTFNTSKGQEI